MRLKPRALTLVRLLGRFWAWNLYLLVVMIFPWGGSGMLDAWEGCRDAELHQQTLWRSVLGPVKVLEPCQSLENLLPLSAAAVEMFPWSFASPCRVCPAPSVHTRLSWMCNTPASCQGLSFSWANTPSIWVQSWENPGFWAVSEVPHTRTLTVSPCADVEQALRSCQHLLPQGCSPNPWSSQWLIVSEGHSAALNLPLES